MSDQHDPLRRTVLTALAGLTLSGISLTPAVADTGSLGGNKSRTLVAFFSRSGNTRVIAGIIHRHLQTDLFEIETAIPYPLDYFETVAQAKNERDRGIKPALKNSVPNFDRYHTLYLGFPIWGTTVPPAVQRFLSTHDCNGKALIPFITHGGYGAGNSQQVVASLAPGAKREPALVMECDQERRTTEAVTDWLGAVRS